MEILLQGHALMGGQGEGAGQDGRQEGGHQEGIYVS
jgi:hypothetical protein